MPTPSATPAPDCRRCRGFGWVLEDGPEWNASVSPARVDCPDCYGTGVGEIEPADPDEQPVDVQ